MRRIAEAFVVGSAQGLLALLAVDLVAVLLPPSLAYWRDFARQYLQRLCHAGADPAAPAPMISIEPSEVAELILQAPPMQGGAEFLTPDVLAARWWELGALIQRETAAEGFAAWLNAHHPQWHAVGRVTFHLAENKRDEERPFAFLATYTHRLSEQGKAQHLPLGRALQEYAGAKNQAALANLLAPVQRASEQSELARELIESRRVFQPLAWTPTDAHRFLQEIPLLEASGLTVRVPDWWKARQPARPQVQVKIGQQPGGGLLGADSLLDFSVGVALDGETLSKAEWKQLMAAKAGLVLLRGKWVEIDKERLQQVLAHWRQVERGSEGGVSFLEGMRMDERPELLFVLRGVDHLELIAAATQSLHADLNTPATGKAAVLDEGSLAEVFGIEIAEMATSVAPAPAPKAAKAAKAPARAATKRIKESSAGTKKLPRRIPARKTPPAKSAVAPKKPARVTPRAAKKKPASAVPKKAHRSRAVAK